MPSYGFDAHARVIGRFPEVIGLERYALYVFDYGAPTGFRLAMAHPERVTAIISQNGNAYEEGLSTGWNPIQRYWRDPSAANREALRELLTPASIRWQYEHGVSDIGAVSPDGSALDTWYMARPEVDEIQLDLFGDYASNVALYPAFQAYRGDGVDAPSPLLTRDIDLIDCDRPVEAYASATQPEGWPHLAAHRTDNRSVAPAISRPSSLAGCMFRQLRESSERFQYQRSRFSVSGA